MPESTELKNASQFPKHYYARHMQPGICGYDNETVLVDTDALKLMAGNNAVGKPVYLLHQDVDLDTMKEKSCGYIIDSFYNELDGWDWFKILIVDDEAHAAIAKKWKVSNAYRPTEWGVGGTKNNVPFHREIKNGEFTHLAIVPDPRYEDADILTPEQFKAYQESKKRQLEELRNSKANSEGKKMFKLFKTERKEVSTVDADTSIELENGKTITVAEMLNAVKKNDDDAAEKEKAKKEESGEEGDKKNAEKMNGDSMVKCNDGSEMPLKDLVNKYNAQEKKNAEDKEAEDKKNAEDEKKKKDEKDEEDKKNAKNFDELQNAHHKSSDSVRTVETGMDKLARGKSAYGSQV